MHDNRVRALQERRCSIVEAIEARTSATTKDPLEPCWKGTKYPYTPARNMCVRESKHADLDEQLCKHVVVPQLFLHIPQLQAQLPVGCGCATQHHGTHAHQHEEGPEEVHGGDPPRIVLVSCYALHGST